MCTKFIDMKEGCEELLTIVYFKIGIYEMILQFLLFLPRDNDFWNNEKGIKIFKSFYFKFHVLLESEAILHPYILALCRRLDWAKFPKVFDSF